MMNEIMDVINLIGEKKLSLGEEIKIIEELKSYQKIAKKKAKKKVN